MRWLNLNLNFESDSQEYHRGREYRLYKNGKDMRHSPHKDSRRKSHRETSDERILIHSFQKEE